MSLTVEEAKTRNKEVIDEVLKVYPEKTAKKRAKHLNVHEEGKADCGVKSNIKSLPGVMTIRGCAYAGSKGVVWGPIKDMVHVSHGPVGCGQYSRAGRRNYYVGTTGVDSFGTMNFTSDFQEKDIVFGGDKKLAKLLGDKKPLTAHTVFRFDGGGNSAIASPAFAVDIPGEEPGKVSRMSWQGFNANVDFTKNLQSYTMSGEAPKLEMLDANGIAAVMTGLKFSGEQTRIFDDEPLLYSGTQRFTMAQMSIADKNGKEQPVLLKQIAYDIAMPASGEFLDMVAKMGAEGVQVGEQNYGPAHYDFSLKHLHARTTAKLYRAMMKMYSDPVALADPTKAFAPLAEPGLELLKHNPEFRIDRLSFKTPQGEAAGSASAKLKDAKPEDLANPMMLLAKLEASADIALPESLLANMSGGAMHAASEGEAPDPETVAAHKEMLEQQLAGFAEQGYITRAGGLVKSKIEFRDGQLTVNGKPFNPMAMRGPAPAEAVSEEEEPGPARTR